jgi:hypothetical protein
MPRVHRIASLLKRWLLGAPSTSTTIWRSSPSDSTVATPTTAGCSSTGCSFAELDADKPKREAELERKTMPEQACALRIATLTPRLSELEERRAELAAADDDELDCKVSGCGQTNSKRPIESFETRGYLMAITIESGPIKCSARVVVKPASFIQPMQSAAV